MNCPICKNIKLENTILHNTAVDYCSKCLGIWFDKDELKQAINEKEKDLNWLDIDLWKDSKKLNFKWGIRKCPHCRIPMYELYYGDSKVIIDICKTCNGIWLDRAEFKKIVEWLKEKEDYEIMHNYSQNLLKELGEVFVGPEPLREEIADFITILKLFKYKFGSEHNQISSLLLNLPR